MAGEVEALAHGGGAHVTVTGRRIQLCVQALEEVDPTVIPQSRPMPTAIGAADLAISQWSRGEMNSLV
jgi:hypothetical protein